MKNIFLGYFIFVLLIWSFLTATMTVINAILGVTLAIMTGIAVIIMLSYYLKNIGFIDTFDKTHNISSGVISFGYLIIFIPYFFFLILKSAINVIWLTLAPNKVSPGIIEYKTELNDPYSVTVLASLITLTPGTMTIDYNTRNHSLFIHVLSIKNEEDRSIMESSLQELENWIGRILAWL